MKRLKQKLLRISIVIQIKLLALFSKRKAAEKALRVFQTPLRRLIIPPTELFQSAEKLESDFNGTIVRGFRWQSSANRTALILHGLESSVLNFEMYVQPLIDKGYRVLAFDAPAHGISDGRRINVLEYRNFIIHLHEQFGPVHAFIGHSFAGLAIALAIEKIPHDDSTKLVLIAPATETTTVFRNYFKLLRLQDKKVSDHFEELIIQIGGQPSAWYSVSRAMKQIRARVLWAHDENDPITPIEDALQVKEKNYPNIKFVLTKGLGHKNIYRDKKVILAIVDFL